MVKTGEISYLEMPGAAGTAHAVNKPFSDSECGNYLISLGSIRNLLPPPPARILDLGCGTGWTSCLLAKMGYEVVGQDISPDMMHYANVNKQSYQVQNCRFIVRDYEDLDFECEFDAAVFFDSLHHAMDEETAIRRVAAALKQGGICVTHEPGEGHAESGDAQQAVREFGVTEKDMPPQHIIELAMKHGFTKSEVYPYPEVLVELAYTRNNSTRWKRLKRRLMPHRSNKRRIANLLKETRRAGGIVVLTK